MKRLVLLAAAAALLSLAPRSALAGVNCTQVKKYLDTGRTPEDIADTMVIPVDEVKKCQAGGDAKSETKEAAPAAAGKAQAPSTGQGQGSGSTNK